MASLNISHFERIESYLPVQLLTPAGFCVALAVLSGFIWVRYFILVGLFYQLFWRSLARSESRQYLHDQEIKPGQLAHEIKWSMFSTLIFAFSGWTLGVLWQNGWSLIYLPFRQLGWGYLPLSFLGLTFIHEVYFYLTHVWMHYPSVYRRIHSVHHFSRKTSPWASFSFHPGEALIQAAFLPLVSLILPLHPLVIIAYLTFMTLTAISNHLGVELVTSPGITSWFISGEHHALHHERFNCNYGLYYRFLDRWLATEAPGDRKVVTRKAKGELCKNPS